MKEQKEIREDTNKSINTKGLNKFNELIEDIARNTTIKGDKPVYKGYMYATQYNLLKRVIGDFITDNFVSKEEVKNILENREYQIGAGGNREMIKKLYKLMESKS